jgi:hypothetical protein
MALLKGFFREGAGGGGGDSDVCTTYDEFLECVRTVGHRAEGAGSRVQGPGSRVQGPGSRVQGPGRGSRV